MNRWYEMEGKDRFAAQDGSEESDRLAIVDLECAKYVSLPSFLPFLNLSPYGGMPYDRS
jgi:hypothetical protein